MTERTIELTLNTFDGQRLITEILIYSDEDLKKAVKNENSFPNVKSLTYREIGRREV